MQKLALVYTVYRFNYITGKPCRKWTIWHIQLSVLYQLPCIPLSDMEADPQKTKLHPREMEFGFSQSIADAKPALPAPSWGEVRFPSVTTRCLGAGTAGLVLLTGVEPARLRTGS